MISLDCNCDKCNETIYNGDIVYCHNCFENDSMLEKISTVIYHMDLDVIESTFNLNRLDAMSLRELCKKYTK